LYGYFKYSYAQRYVGKYHIHEHYFCKECTENASLALLVTFHSCLCGQTEHAEWEPDKKTLAGRCAEIGEE